MITRAQYLADHTLHRAYYSEIAKECGIIYTNSPMLPRIKAALAAGDQHLNTISLVKWDSRASFTKMLVSAALKKRGDFYSMVGGVCVHKCAALDAAK